MFGTIKQIFTFTERWASLTGYVIANNIFGDAVKWGIFMPTGRKRKLRTGLDFSCRWIRICSGAQAFVLIFNGIELSDIVQFHIEAAGLIALTTAFLSIHKLKRLSKFPTPLHTDL